MDVLKTDIAIIGGGIAGLWTLNRLCSLGYDARLFEKTALGSGQTIAAQGIIHGGMKYTLGGITQPQASTLAAMPQRWLDCLEGRGEIDLRKTDILSRRHEVRARTPVGDVRLHDFTEPVIAVKSLLQNLRDNESQRIHYTQPFESRLTIHACGMGNEEFASGQRRPMRMMMCRTMNALHYAHYAEMSTKPRVTITAHLFEGEVIWYLGGNLAEKAVGMNTQTAINWAKSEMKALFPDLLMDWDRRGWAVHDVDRCEPLAGMKLPNGPVLHTEGNTATAWPAKMALAPVLADKVALWVQRMGVHPTRRPQSPRNDPVPQVAKYPWEEATWH